MRLRSPRPTPRALLAGFLSGFCLGATVPMRAQGSATAGAATATSPAAGTTAPRVAGVILRPQIAQPRVLTRVNPNHLVTIEGQARTLSNDTLTKTIVRLRDARLGRIVGSEVTDNAGAFAFRGVAPGSYIAEILGPDRAVLSASQLITANAGEAATVILRLPANLSRFAGLLGPQASAEALTSQAASAGGLAAQVFVTPISDR